MKKSVLIIIIILAASVSATYSVYTYIQNMEESEIDINGYVEAKATVTRVHLTRITRYGTKQPRYDIRFTNQKNEEQQRFRCELGSGYNVGDTLTILYHPGKPEAEIILKSM